MDEIKTTEFFDKHDPLRIAMIAKEKMEYVKEHYTQFPYESVFNYGATDRLYQWWEILGEILGEEKEKDSSSINKVREV